MPQPRKYKTNADRQAAYRARKARKEAGVVGAVTGDPGAAIVRRVMAADRRA